MAENLKDNQSSSLNNIKENIVKSLAETLKGTQSTRFDLGNKNIDCNDLEYLSEALRETQITTLDLSNNNLGCNGLKYLTQVLRSTRICTLNVKNNNIMDEGVKCLAESLKDTQITELDLSENKIGIDAAQFLNTKLSDTKMCILYLDIHYSEDNDVSKYISQRSFYDINRFHITLYNNKIGSKGAQYLNKTFLNIPIAKLELDRKGQIQADDAEYLNQAFKGTKICELIMHYSHILQPYGVPRLVQTFKDSQIAVLTVKKTQGFPGASYLANFLEQINVLDLDLSDDYIGDQGLKYLVPALKNSDIMYINLGKNNIKADGARYLSEILRNSKILYVNLCNNKIGPDGAKYLADSLPFSQVTGIHLHGNMIEDAGYQYLIDVIDDTNISWANLNGNNIHEILEDGTETQLYPSLLRNTTPVADKIRRAFEEIVSLNPTSNEFEFTVPKKTTLPRPSIDQYLFLIKTLNENPNSKAHIFDMMCRKNHIYYDLYAMNKINEFIKILPNKFNTFIDSKLPDIVETFENFDYVNLVKQFEDMKMYDIVQNLLLHRVLYYVDENQEFLHPYIYKMLDKYRMPLFNEQLEPNKKEEIIAYYESHQEIDGVQEILELLHSKC